MRIQYSFVIGVVVIVFVLGWAYMAEAINRISLSQVQASFVGEDAKDHSGQSVSIVSDVNGDGHDDILIGAWRADRAGQTYLIFGKPSGWAMRTDLTSADASFVGEGEENYSGWSVSGTCDVNGDGYNDILIGDPCNSDGGFHAGQSYLILGRANGWQIGMSLAEANASFIGEDSLNSAGYSVSGAGDVNGDGYDDFLIGAYVSNRPGHQGVIDKVGQTYLFFGKPDGWQMRTSLSEADASFFGEAMDDRSGISVSGAGDVNGDGYDDILIGAPMNNDGGEWAGQTYLVFGKPSGWRMRTLLSRADASFIGENPDDLSGTLVSGAGDVNGDGYDDFLIGACQNDYEDVNAGQAYLFLGGPDGWRMRMNVIEADASFVGNTPYSHCGYRVSIARDVNGDSYDEILIDGEFGLEVFLILGKSEGWYLRTPLSQADVSFILENDGNCWGLSGSGDINNDSFNDILIGDAYNSDGGKWAGQTYLCFFPQLLMVETDDLPRGVVNFAYSETLSATGGVPPYRWELFSGALPEKLSLDMTGFISGVPTTADTFSFTIQVTDSASRYNRKELSLIIIQGAMKADVNIDGQINIVDAVFAVNIVLELYDPTPAQYWAADCNDDGAVNIQDIICLINIILGEGERR